MIIGHIGAAIGARRRWPAIPVAALLAATFLPDLVRKLLENTVFLSPDADFHSHALPWSLLLAVGAGGVAWLATRSRVTALVICGVVLSHVALDMISGTKALWAGGPTGFNVRAFAPLELVVESTLVIAAWRYLRQGSASRPWYASSWMPVALVVLEAVLLAGSISQRPYLSRCIGHPALQCDGGMFLTRRWDTGPFWE
ncbi:MAG: hypothetical protein ABIY52_14710 [Gemmatimonadaceae bacterium]